MKRYVHVILKKKYVYNEAIEEEEKAGAHRQVWRAAYAQAELSRNMVLVRRDGIWYQ